MEQEILPFGDRALIIRFKGEKLECIKRVKGVLNLLIDRKIGGVLDFIPTISSLTIVFDPLTISFKALKNLLSDILAEEVYVPLPAPKLFNIPTVYGGRFGPDLKFVAEFNGISEEEVIKIHSERIYTVYMIGFIPGFLYLGEVSEKISVPRLKTPRILVPEGSVGIGGNFTGVYPLPSPGGWRIIGMTYFNPLDLGRIPPVGVDILDRVKFTRISEEEFLNNYKGKINFIGGGDD